MDQGSKGRGSKGPEDRGTRGPRDQETEGPGTKGPEDQGAGNQAKARCEGGRMRRDLRERLQDLI